MRSGNYRANDMTLIVQFVHHPTADKHVVGSDIGRNRPSVPFQLSQNTVEPFVLFLNSKGPNH